jgi:hypothetical protein
VGVAPLATHPAVAKHNALVKAEREHAALVKQYTRQAPKKRPRFRPQNHRRLGTRAKEAVKKLFDEARDWGRHLPQFRREPKMLPRRSTKVAEYVLPGVDTRPVRPYSGRPLTSIRLGEPSTPARVIALSPEKLRKSAPLKSGKSSIQELTARGVKIGLKAAPFSDDGNRLTNGNFLNLQRYKGGWIVTNQGVHLGFVKKLKKGWDQSGIRNLRGEGAEKAAEAINLLDEYYDAGGK